MMKMTKNKFKLEFENIERVSAFCYNCQTNVINRNNSCKCVICGNLFCSICSYVLTKTKKITSYNYIANRIGRICFKCFKEKIGEIKNE